MLVLIYILYLVNKPQKKTKTKNASHQYFPTGNVTLKLRIRNAHFVGAQVNSWQQNKVSEMDSKHITAPCFITMRECVIWCNSVAQ